MSFTESSVRAVKADIAIARDLRKRQMVRRRLLRARISLSRSTICKQAALVVPSRNSEIALRAE